ncbi:hypothetical protein GA0070216_105326 [Micromonospora matsumotoense]|uniref:Uncharacterized protein n=1 Tax=Micromonospora matsumotoense TaxID=121616 RepID=A0A1C4Y293_9ACTN|nr:hypothetical protein [Micromonospora matsumotoense]SCF14834.1 hypothetical protein GA0070216_105326 [Micromonospora matsumotoense]
MEEQIALAVATALATKGAEAFGAGAREAIASLFRLVRDRFGAGTRESVVLDGAVEHPEEQWRQTALASALAEVMARDPQFATALKSEWHRLAGPSIIAAQGQVANHFSGTAEKVVQARDVRGDIVF